MTRHLRRRAAADFGLVGAQAAPAIGLTIPRNVLERAQRVVE